MRTLLALVVSLATFAAAALAQSQPHVEFTDRYAQEVDKRLTLPPEEAHGYALRLADLLAEAANREPQFVVMVDRSPAVQAVFVYWGSPDEGWSLVGASPASTGLPGAFEQSVDTLFDLYQLHRARGA